jgi:hypothetical protein
MKIKKKLLIIQKKGLDGYNMLDSLYEKALLKKDNINKKISTDFDNLGFRSLKGLEGISYN